MSEARGSHFLSLLSLVTKARNKVFSMSSALSSKRMAAIIESSFNDYVEGQKKTIIVIKIKRDSLQHDADILSEILKKASHTAEIAVSLIA